MLRGIRDRVEAWLIQAMGDADGHRLQACDGDQLAPRTALAQLDADGFDASTIVLSVEGWARMESARTSGSGEYIFRTSPVDARAGTLWGVPIGTSAKAESGTA